MMKEVTFGNVRLIHGSCLEALPLLDDVAGVITDPPYSSGATFAKGRTEPKPSQKYRSSGNLKTSYPEFDGENRDQRSFTIFNTLWAEQARKITKPGGVLVAFTDWRQLPVSTDYLQLGGWTWRGIGQWEKTSPRPARGRFAAAAEYFVWGSKGSMPANRNVRPLKGSFKHTAPTRRTHITQKPIGLMNDIVEVIEPGGVIVDPFMGSGTTGMAAILAGHPFIGIESDPEIFEMASNRLRELAMVG